MTRNQLFQYIRPRIDWLTLLPASLQLKFACLPDRTATPGWIHRPDSITQPKFAAGFSYIEVLVALFILSIAAVPAMEALQSGIQGASIHKQTTQQHYALLAKMENVLADSYVNLLSAAQAAGNPTTATSYSDPGGQSDRVIVYLSLYDADANPFTLTDPDNDGDANIYTGDTSYLLWIKVELENSHHAFESLRKR